MVQHFIFNSKCSNWGLKLEYKIYVVDDDLAARTSLQRMLALHDYSVEVFESGEAFLEQIDRQSYGVVLLDIAMPQLSGTEVQQQLLEQAIAIPLIFLTGHGDVPTSVQAMKNGAVDFLEKPYSVDVLLEKLNEALDGERTRQAQAASQCLVLTNFANLTSREKEIMAALSFGHAQRSNKEIAAELNLSPRTVEEYRSRVMSKMQAQSITHLVEMAKQVGIYKHQA